LKNEFAKEFYLQIPRDSETINISREILVKLVEKSWVIEVPPLRTTQYTLRVCKLAHVSGQESTHRSNARTHARTHVSVHDVYVMDVVYKKKSCHR